MYSKYLKRALDILLSGFAMPFLLLFIFVFGMIIKIEDSGPIFFRQERVGKGGKVFNILKLRSMYINTPANMPTHAVDKPDRYITRVGKFMRRWSIDELPQIINVFVGDMSIIGPRPLIPAEKEINDARLEFGVNVKPGLTGLAQVNGRDLVNDLQKFQYDLKYVRNVCFSVDLRIFLRTIRCVFFAKGYCEGNQLTVKENQILSKEPEKSFDNLY